MKCRHCDNDLEHNVEKRYGVCMVCALTAHDLS